jgi:hypothetical protein
VLDFSYTRGKIAALAKQAIGSRLVIGLNSVLGFFAINITAYLTSYSLIVAPTSNLVQRVYLIKGNITNSNISKYLVLITSKPAYYNIIFLVYAFKTIPSK